MRTKPPGFSGPSLSEDMLKFGGKPTALVTVLTTLRIFCLRLSNFVPNPADGRLVAKYGMLRDQNPPASGTSHNANMCWRQFRSLRSGIKGMLKYLVLTC